MLVPGAIGLGDREAERDRPLPEPDLGAALAGEVAGGDDGGLSRTARAARRRVGDHDQACLAAGRPRGGGIRRMGEHRAVAPPREAQAVPAGETARLRRPHDVAAADSVAEDEPISVSIAGKEIGIFRVNGTLYAIEDVCPHAYALLSQGFVEGEEVECPLHQAVFHIPTGRCLREPAERDVATYPVKEEHGRVVVEL